MTETDPKTTCVRCEKQMGNYMGGRGVQPATGLAFHSHGHYGSAYFDPMDGSYIVISVCDDCIRSADEKGRVSYSNVWHRPVTAALSDKAMEG